MQRVMILGISGAGKSTLARQLEARLGLPAYHLDFIYHRPGWVARPEADVRRDFEAIAMQDRWVVDGNYRHLTSSIRDRADTILFLDFGRGFAIGQIILRWALHRSGLKQRADLGDGFTERLGFDFVPWVWNWRRDNRGPWMEEFASMKDKVTVFTSRTQVRHWLETVA